ncbi:MULTISPECIES: ABC transporter substrate-binding protein [Vibrio]|uniref:ABC transporter substrate-binding protein n=1 Tax=Vibrio TaxID=662 RepID=UPI0020757768|nr:MULTISPECIES: ABC transporter substrate binding protein [Vibrio]USD34356.1 hypothetical protein J8Z27_20200 [Vibrio sp. SCSIO 43186]USD47427.1 hypothetical protein J4N38_20600 [Vibrio sp. SCSIO 43145]USD71481.1 hypothetical protein J4N41_20215 [Vibrio sp. SCSIO 43139]USD98388.1 hypothetical protein CTT30_20405 [Vibrio coralliilyticus]
MRGLVLCLLFYASVSQAEKVLLIESYHAEYPWDVSYVKGIEEALTQSAVLYRFQMDTKRLPKEEFEARADQALSYYYSLQPDVVILGDDNALSYMLPRLYKESIPIVFLGVNANPRYLLYQYRGSAKVTGVLELPLYIKTLGDLSVIYPERYFKVRVMFDSGITSKIAAKYIERQHDMIKDNLGIETEILLLSTQHEWESAIKSAAADNVSIIIIGLYHTLKDEHGESVPSEQILQWTNENSTIPLFAFWDFAVGEGKASGGVVLFGESQGKQAANLVNKILDGESADQIPIIIGEQGRAIYSATEMQRWGLAPPSHWQAID